MLSARKRRKLTGAILSLAAAALFLLAQSQGWLPEQPGNLQVPPAPGMYRVIRFEDGDTITVDMNGIDERVRMIGVDTPETQDPRVSVQCFGRAASAYTKDLIGANDVRLEADPLNTNRDRYDRLLRYVYLPDGRLVNAEIIRSGYGFAYTLFPFSKADEFRGYETEAREQNRGLWATCQINQDGDKKTTNPAPL